MNQEKVYRNLRDKKSSLILIELKQFTSKTFPKLISEHLDCEKISNEYQDFVYKTVNTYSQIYNIEFEIYKNAYSIITNCFESIITKSIYNRAIALCQTKAAGSSDTLLDKYSFLTPSNLRLTASIDSFRLKNQIELFSQIIYEKSPLNKIMYIINLIQYLEEQYKDDNIICLLIYVLISTNIPGLKSNIIYCRMFRTKTAIESKEDYYLQIIETAFEKIDSLEINHEILDLTGIEFKSKCNEYYKRKTIDLIAKELIVIKEKTDKSFIRNIFDTKKLSGMLSCFIQYGKFTQEMDEKQKFDLKEINSLENIPIQRIYKKYFENYDFKSMSYIEIEQIYNDFKIILKLIESDLKS